MNLVRGMKTLYVRNRRRRSWQLRVLRPKNEEHVAIANRAIAFRRRSKFAHNSHLHHPLISRQPIDRIDRGLTIEDRPTPCRVSRDTSPTETQLPRWATTNLTFDHPRTTASVHRPPRGGEYVDEMADADVTVRRRRFAVWMNAALGEEDAGRTVGSVRLLVVHSCDLDNAEREMDELRRIGNDDGNADWMEKGKLERLCCCRFVECHPALVIEKQSERNWTRQDELEGQRGSSRLENGEREHSSYRGDLEAYV
ncbi:hypothetical protein SCHPADRAFT_688617 [Schizopora paradoxa]|uniref:Uncharacterized protein n=1 Tax=Schizopora paradoxa TaxID=27342 RepID=A0A0H2R3W7_9AGAM|nr:hypothetical protein SCHPADRAFT_688617 [Schizopora paradoxa]